MDIMDRWEKALKKTEIIRPRVQPLLIYETTELPYIFLAESTLNVGDSIVRKGRVFVEKPSILLPENLPQFDGFEFDEEDDLKQDMVMNFLLVRGVRFPSYMYNNKIYSLDVYEGQLKNAIGHFTELLQKAEDVHTGLIIGPEETWQFSVLIFICTMVAKYADRDIKKIIDDLGKKGFTS
jgi:hypothetical protein